MPEPASPYHPKTLSVRVRPGGAGGPVAEAPSGCRPIDFTPFGPLALDAKHCSQCALATSRRLASAHCAGPSVRTLKMPGLLADNSAGDIVADVSLCGAHHIGHESILPLNPHKDGSTADDPGVPPSVAASCRCIYMQAMATRDGTGLRSTLSGTCWWGDCHARSRPAPQRRMPRSDAIWQHAFQRLPLLRQDAWESALRAIAHVTNPSIGQEGNGHTARIDNNLSPLSQYRVLMTLSRLPANDHAATRTRSGDVGCSAPRRQYVRLTLSIDVAAYAGGRSMWWLYRWGLQASRPTSTRLGRQRILPAGGIGASLQIRSADRRAALLAVLDPEFVAGFPPIAARLWWISSTSLIHNSAPDIVARLSLCSLYREGMCRHSAPTSTRIAPPHMSAPSSAAAGASPCRARPPAVGRHCSAHPHARGVGQGSISVSNRPPVVAHSAVMSSGTIPYKGFCHSRKAHGSRLSVPSPMSRSRQTDCREVVVPLALIHYALVLLHVSRPNRGTPVVRIDSGVGWGALKSERYAPVNPRATKPGSGPAFPSRASRCPRDHLWSKNWSRLGSVGRCRCACGDGELT